MIGTALNQLIYRLVGFPAPRCPDDQKPRTSSVGKRVWYAWVEFVITCHLKWLYNWRVSRFFNMIHKLSHFIWRTILLYASELRLGSGLNPLPFFMYPSFFAAVIKFIFGLVFFCVVGIVLVRLSTTNIFIATYDLGHTDLTQPSDLDSLNLFGWRHSEN